MKRLFIYRILWLLLAMPALSGCNDTDDVAAIFTGKTWKLNYITIDGKHEMFDFWNDEDARKKSIEKLNLDNTYTIKFEGVAEGDFIKGQVSGRTITSNFTGTWSANGKDNKFQASVAGTNDDTLAKNFLEGLNTADVYEGDQNNLYLLYTPKSSQRTFRMAFRVVKTQ